MTFKLNPAVAGESVTFDRNECVELGKKLHDTYVNNSPFPHIVMDDFLPSGLLGRVLEEFPARKTGQFNDATSKLKTGYQMEAIESAFITSLMNALNSSQFLEFLEEMTGIKKLIPDPHFAGGGLHETARGGHLSIHADFNINKRLNLHRRMNLILFLNENWKDEYGGHLELWETDMSACAHKVLPEIGRAVVFNTTDDSFHGHPEPLTCPQDTYRRSIALYYYTAPEDGLPSYRTTNFRKRPGSEDVEVSGRPSALKALMKDLTPPLLMRMISRN